jgi:hypothetical protein
VTHSAETSPVISSALERSSAARPGLQTAVEIHCITTLGIEELGHPSGAGTYGTDANHPVIHLVQALHQLIHGNVYRPSDTTPCPLVSGTNVEQGPALSEPRTDIAWLHCWNVIAEHMPTLVRISLLRVGPRA